MPSKFFGNRFDKQSNKKGNNSNKKSAKNKAQNQNNRAKSGGVRKVGRGGQNYEIFFLQTKLLFFFINCVWSIC